MDSLDQAPNDSPVCSSASATPAELGMEALMNKINPLIQSGRFDNLVDALSLISDMIDLLDPAMVEKMALLFEQLTSATWEAGNAVRMARAQTAAEPEAPSLYQLLSLLRQEDTRRGCAVALRTLNVIGRQL